jgi:hypothetical protein
MPRTAPPVGDPLSPDEVDLDRLERMVVAGHHALAARCTLVARMVAAGVSQAHITRRLNRVREQGGADLVTVHAVSAILRREAAKNPPE